MLRCFSFKEETLIIQYGWKVRDVLEVRLDLTHAEVLGTDITIAITTIITMMLF